MAYIINKLLSLTWVGDIIENVNGNKTMIGLLSLVVYMLDIVPSIFPDFGLPLGLSLMLNEALKYVGVLLPIGAAHKISKRVVGDK